MMKSLGPHSLPLARPLPDAAPPRRHLLGLPDGYETPVYVHAPQDPCRRRPVLFLHGIQSHPGWFAGGAYALAQRGHAVFQPTRRGSGENQPSRGHAASAAQLLADMDCVMHLVRAETGADRPHLLAVSWGGKLAAAWAASRPGAAASLTLVAPGLVPQVDVPWTTKLAIGLCLLLAPRRRFPIPLSDPALFTDHEPMRAYLRADRFALHRATARFLYASRRLDARIRRVQRGAIACPTTLLLAERDRIIDNAATRAAVEHLTAGAADVQTLPGAHVLEFEPDPTAYYAALAEALARGEP
jgi:alpha-beta hydrolase superfamily lysophospholipase